MDGSAASWSFDPLRRFRRRCRLVTALALAVVAACAVWSMWPVRVDPHDTTFDPRPRAPDETQAVGKSDWRPDRQVFRLAELWNPLPSPAPPAEEERNESVRRPSLSLVGIVIEDHDRLAVLYDPDTDRLHLLRAGERIEPFMVESIDDSAVTIRDGSFVVRLDVSKREESS